MLQLFRRRLQTHIDKSASVMQEFNAEVRDISNYLLSQIQNMIKQVDNIETRLDFPPNWVDCLQKDSQSKFHDENIIQELID